MADYRFALEKGGRKVPCPACKRIRFVPYIDTYTGEPVASEVGRCDREDSCGYHLTPSEYFYMTGKNPFSTPRPARKPQTEPEPEQPSFIDTEIMRASMTGYNQNNHCRWLCSVFGEQKAFDLTAVYKIGTSKHWPGSCVFWQIDRDGKIRTGKIMLYDSLTGRRVIKPFPHVNWVHKVMKIEPYTLQQCLFGEHLLSLDGEKPVAIVESEKTAIVASGFIPEYVWLATAGKHNLNTDKLKSLCGRKVTLYPDLMAFDKWKVIADRVPGVTVSDLLERRASEADRAAGLDLVDYLLRENRQTA
ncbi:MAG: DUF6371 domain-containing protein [Chlorobiales bacterium]|nr:DUF6371 domain-containing protein [Chlorobiales bacterium]